MASEDYPYCRHAIVPIGPDRWVTLCCRVALVPGMGQVWHTTGDNFVASRIDIRGQIVWSLLVCSLAEFMVTTKVPASEYVPSCQLAQ